MALPAHAAWADTSSPSAAGEFVAAINSLRASHGLGALTVNSSLVGMASAWSVHLAGAGSLSHNPGLASQAPAGWRLLGENVGVGPNVAALHQAFVNSPEHYRNMVDPRFTSIGVAVDVSSAGYLWVTEDYMEAPAVAAAPVRAVVPPAPPKPVVPAVATPAPVPVVHPVARPAVTAAAPVPVVRAAAASRPVALPTPAPAAPAPAASADPGPPAGHAVTTPAPSAAPVPAHAMTRPASGAAAGSPKALDAVPVRHTSRSVPGALIALPVIGVLAALAGRRRHVLVRSSGRARLSTAG